MGVRAALTVACPCDDARIRGMYTWHWSLLSSRAESVWLRAMLLFAQCGDACLQGNASIGGVSVSGVRPCGSCNTFFAGFCA